YQIIEGRHIEVKSRYKLIDQILTFEFPEGYNSEYELIIDPELVFATYSGATAGPFVGVGSGECYVHSTTYDREGSLYVGVRTNHLNWPTNTSSFQASPSPSFGCAAIAKYNATGTALMYATYYSGTSHATIPAALRVTDSLELVMTGSTQ